nr:hypothetical protein Iba_chr06aCG16130 [Ipomoea batatas]
MHDSPGAPAPSAATAAHTLPKALHPHAAAVVPPLLQLAPSAVPPAAASSLAIDRTPPSPTSRPNATSRDVDAPSSFAAMLSFPEFAPPLFSTPPSNVRVAITTRANPFAAVANAAAATRRGQTTNPHGSTPFNHTGPSRSAVPRLVPTVINLIDEVPSPRISPGWRSEPRTRKGSSPTI